MPEVVQLRIHGVGGATPEGLLGLPPGADAVRVAGDEGAGFYARPSDPRAQAYVWWKLTSGSRAQALWIVLLPFTLFNVANWMYPPGEGGRKKQALVLSRFLMFFLGVSLTLAYLLWAFTLIVQQLFHQWSLNGRLDELPGWLVKVLPSYLDRATTFRAALGMLGVVLVGIVVYVVARRTRKDFEEVRGPRDRVDPLPEPKKSAALGFPLLEPERLNDPRFWSRAKESTRLLRLHLVAGIVLFGALVAWTLPKANHGEETFHLRPWFLWLARVQIGIILLLLAVYLVGWGGRGAFRVAPPVVVALASVALTTGFFSGLTYWVANKTNQSFTLDYDQGAAFGIGSIMFSASFLAWLWWHWHRRRHELDSLIAEGSVPCNAAPPGEEPDGVSTSMLRTVALVRAFSGCITRIDLVLSVSAFSFLLAAFPSVFTRWDLPTAVRTQLLAFGGWVLSALVAVALPALLFRAFQPSAQAKVKIIWDITTFWPRRFHPLAVRPYAERAVPEIQGRLFELVVNHEKRVVIAAHSQGSVLAYCALVHLAGWERGRDKITPNVAFVTFGSPLRRIHARFFPAYFGYPQDFNKLHSALFQGGSPCLGWKNFYRRTDYVGQSLFEETGMAGCDHELPDPPQAPAYRHRSLTTPWTSPADPPQPIFTKTVVHSYYNNAVELRRWVDGDLRRSLES